MKSFKSFFLDHKTLFDIIFLGVYTIEQLLLVVLVFLVPGFAHIVSAIFAVLLISTISLERVAMEKRYHLLKEVLLVQESESDKIKAEYQSVMSDNARLQMIVDIKAKN